MSTSVGRNVVLSTLANLIHQLVRAGQQLVWVPLFLAAFKTEGYGEWLTLFGLAGYATMADLGVQFYWLNLLTGSHVKNDLENYRRLFRGGIFLYAAVAGVVLSASLIFAVSLGPMWVLGLKVISPHAASIIFLLLIASTLMNVLSSMLRGTFRTVGQNPKVMWFVVSKDVIVFAFIATALSANQGPVRIAFVHCSISVIMLLWVVITTRRRFPELVDLGIHRADRAAITRLVYGGSTYLVGVLANLLLVQGTLIITNWMLGAAVVALVATTRTIANLVRQAAGSVYLSTQPEFTRLEAASNNVAIERLLRGSVCILLILSGCAVITLVGLGPWLFDVWTNNRFPNAAPLIYLFSVSVIVDVLRMSLYSFLIGCNRILPASISNIVYAISSLVVMWIISPWLGACSIPISIIVCGVAIQFPFVAFDAAKIIGKRSILVIIAKMMLGVFITIVVATPLVICGAKGFGIKMMFLYTTIALVVFSVLAWFVLLNREDIAMARSRITKLYYKMFL